MATASVTYTFANDTEADATEVNENFGDLVDFLNASVVHKDGTVAMTGHLELPGSDPTTANQAARKSYVDAVAGGGGALTAYTPTLSGTGASLGNGTIAGAYRQAGQMLDFRAVVTRGSTTTFTNGGLALQISLPSGKTAISGQIQGLVGWANDVSAATVSSLVARVNASGTTALLYYVGFGLDHVDETAPFTWASGDTVAINGRIEVAV